MVLIQNYNEVKQYKKTIILILCLIISLSLISCTKSVETIPQAKAVIQVTIMLRKKAQLSQAATLMNKMRKV